MTKKFYVADTATGGVHHGAGVARESTTTDPGTGSPVDLSQIVTGSANNFLFPAFYSPSGEPNSDDWPTGAYTTQIDVSTAGADLLYGTDNLRGGHHARVSSAANADLETSSGVANASGTGIKTIVNDTSRNFAAGSAGDRYEVLIGVDNANMMDQTLTIRINTSNTFMRGPWLSEWVQTDFRGRNDDGSETTATWKAAQNTNWSQNVDENFRVRFQLRVKEGSVESGILSATRLQYRRNGGSWTDVSATSLVVRASASPNVVDGAATTDQLTGGFGSFLGGAFDEDSGLASGPSAAWDTGHGELEYCVQIRSADVANGDTVELRLQFSDQTARTYTTWSQVPTITVVEGGGGTQYSQGLTASLSFTGATVKQGGKALTASLSFTGAINKAISTARTAALSFTGAIAKQASKSFSGSISPGGALASARVFLRDLTASLGLDGALIKQARKPLTASVGFAGGLVKSTSRTIAASLGLAGSLVKSTARSLTASLTLSGALTTVRQVLVNLTASLGFSGNLARSTARSLTASLGLDGALLKRANKTLSASLDFSGAVTSLKAFFREFSATLDFSGNLTRVSSFVRSFTASLSPTTAFVRAATRTIPGSASVSFNASLSTIRVFLRSLTATLTFDGTLTKSTSRAFSAVVDFAGNLASQFQGGANQFFESFTASLTFSGGLVKSTGKSLQASLSSSGALIKSTSRQIEAALTLSASVARRTVRALSAGLSFTGALSTASVIVRAFSAALSFTGSLASASIFARSFAAALSFAAQVGRATTRQIPANLSFEGQVSKLTARALVGALTLSGSLSRMTARFLAGAVTFTGSIASQVLTGGQRVLIAAGRVTVGLSARASTQVVARASSAFRVAGQSAASLASRFRIGKE